MNNLGLDRTAAAMLMVESDMPGVAATDELERAETACRVAGATDVVRAADAQEADWLRQARRAAHYALERLGDVRMEDVGVPRSRVPDMLREIERIAAKHDVRIGTFGHAGDGNLHPDLVFDRGDPQAEAKTDAVKTDLYRAALALGGTVTGEHGIGSARREWLEIQRGADAVRVMRAIKTALDPLGHPQPGARRLGTRRAGRPAPATTQYRTRLIRTAAARAYGAERSSGSRDAEDRSAHRIARSYARTSPPSRPQKGSTMKIPIRLTAFGAALIVLTVGAAPLLSSAADHIDASAFGSLGTPGGAFDPMSVHGERDINDVYAFQGSNASRTVLAMTTNPAINAFGGKFGPDVRYIINVDRDGNAVQDLAYVVRFDNGAAGNQKYTVTRYTGANAVSLRVGTMRGSGSTAGNGTASLPATAKVFAGVRSDPFFFDLTGFVGTLVPHRRRTGSATTRPTSSRGSTPTPSSSRSPTTSSAARSASGARPSGGTAARGCPATRWAGRPSTRCSTPSSSTRTRRRPRTCSTGRHRRSSAPPTAASSGPTSSPR